MMALKTIGYRIPEKKTKKSYTTTKVALVTQTKPLDEDYTRGGAATHARPDLLFLGVIYIGSVFSASNNISFNFLNSGKKSSASSRKRNTRQLILQQ